LPEAAGKKKPATKLESLANGFVGLGFNRVIDPCCFELF
jgi:hypothetical protein